MQAVPFTHHEMLALAAPFAERGLAADLQRSRRDERQLVFRPRDGGHHWELADLGGGRWRVARVWPCGEGLASRIADEGSDAAALLARVDAVPLARQQLAAAGAVVACDYRLAGREPVLAEATLRCGHLRLHLSAAGRSAATLTLDAPGSAARPPLPEDFLAVLGWHWARLVPRPGGWTTRLRLRGTPVQRTARAEAALRLAAAHLAATLAEPPAAWHARHRAARWGVFFRRGIPTFTALFLLAAVAGSAWLDWQPSVTTMLLLYHLPTLVVAASFLMQELPRFEIPPWPRPLRAAAWDGGR